MESQAQGCREDVESPYTSIPQSDGMFWERFAL